MTYKFHILEILPEFYNFLQEVANLTISCLNNTKGDANDYVYTWSMEACDILLETWCSLGMMFTLLNLQ